MQIPSDFMMPLFFFSAFEFLFFYVPWHFEGILFCTVWLVLCNEEGFYIGGSFRTSKEKVGNFFL